MIEIIPNWHPVFVHFTIGLLFTSILLFVVAQILPDKLILRDQLQMVAHWNLWIGYAMALITAVFGWVAYNSVTHDAPSHEAMTLHRNWALLTLGIFLPVVIWSAVSFHQINNPTWVFVLVLLIPALFLARTGWLGAEAVYRYGLGVLSLPQSEGKDPFMGVLL
jgi:uncharacterized membrane protein